MIRGTVAISGIILSMLGMVQIAGGQPLIPPNIGGNLNFVSNPQVATAVSQRTSKVMTYSSNQSTTSSVKSTTSMIQSTTSSFVSSNVSTSTWSIILTTWQTTFTTSTTIAPTVSSQTITTQIQTQTSVTNIPPPTPFQIFIHSSIPPITFLFAGMLLILLSLFIGNEIDQQEKQDSSYQP